MRLNLPGYDILETLHEGPRSVICRARWCADDQIVVVKCVASGAPVDSELQRLHRDFEVGRQIRDEHVIKYRDLVPFDHNLAIVQEGWEAANLAQSLCSAGSDLASFLNSAIQIAEGLRAIHRAGVVHKDVTPFNILVASDCPLLKLTDFASASQLRQQAHLVGHPSRLAGRLAYISPEQTGRMSRLLDYRTDFYSLGVTLYELLCGRRPFMASDPLELVHCHLARVPDPPHAIREEIPEVVSAIVMKLLAKNAEERYQSSQGLIHDLCRCQQAWSATGSVPLFSLGEQDISEQFCISQTVFGRDREIAELISAFDRASQGRMQVVFVSGEPGVGKSTLVSEIHQPICSRNGYFVHGKYEQFNRDSTQNAMSQAFRQLIRQLLGESEEQLQIWRHRLLTALGPNGRVLAEVIPELAHLLGPLPPVPEVGLEARRNRFCTVFLEMVRALAQPEHPVVVFLDDLQWTDRSSLQLLRLMAGDPGLRHLLLVGAYRDRDVDESHPLTATLQELQTRSVVCLLPLTSLKQHNVAQWITGTLQCEPERSQSLAELVYRKTSGNPFFVKAFLQSLYDEGLLRLSSPVGWQWDLEQIQREQVTANVADLLDHRLRTFPAPVQEVLSYAACLGSAVALTQLASIVERDTEEIVLLLREVIDAGLLIHADTHLLFAHDRVQQAAHSLLSSERKLQLHLAIGRKLLALTASENRGEPAFDAIDHLNLGRQLLEERDQCVQLAQMNLAAGRKAKVSAAFGAAARYFATGIELLGETGWSQHRELCLALYREQAECEHFLGNFAEAQRLAAAAHQHCVDDLERAAVYLVRITQASLQAQYARAVQLGIEALGLFGLELPDIGDRAAIESCFAQQQREHQARMSGRTIDDLFDLPLTRDPRHEAVMNICASLFDCTLIGVPEYLRVITMLAVNYCLQHGNTRVAPFAYASHAIALVELRDYQAAYEFGEMALRLNEKRLHNAAIVSRVRNMFAGFLAHYRQPFHVRHEICTRGHRAGMECGDILYAGYCLVNRARGDLFAGVPLGEVVTRMEGTLAVLHRLHQQSMPDLVSVFRGFVLALQGPSNKPGSLDHEDFTEEAFRERYADVPVLTAHLDAYRVRACFLLGDYQSAAAVFRTTDLAALEIQVEGKDCRFFGALSLLQQELADDSKTLVEEQQNLLAQLAACCPENFRSEELMLAAEVARISGRTLEAMDLYDSAIAAAQRSSLVHNEALASELAARFWVANGKPHLAVPYLQRALPCYRRWGALAKVAAIHNEYPELVTEEWRTDAASPKAGSQEGSIVGNATTDLDLLSVTKAAQAISTELTRERIVRRLMAIILENAGARRACLILTVNGQPTLMADVTVDSPAMSASPPVPLENCQHAPVMLIQYVLRTGEHVLLNDLSQPGPFEHDPYLRQHGLKSLLCIPLRLEDRGPGVLYLEHDLATYVFTEERLQFLDVLLSQAAISLDNARLYEAMRTEIAERKCVEEQLRESRERLQSILDNTIAVVYVKGLDGAYLTINQQFERLYHVDAREIVGQTDEDVFPLATARCLRSNDRQVIEANQPLEFEEQIPQDDGPHTYISIKFPLRDGAGEPYAVCGISTDITARKRAEEEKSALEDQLRQAQKMEAIGQLAGGVAHDFNNILTAILGYVEIAVGDLREGMPSSTANLLESLEQIGKSAHRASSLTGQLLAFSRRQVTQPTILDLNHMLADMEKMLHRLLSENIRLVTHVQPGLGFVLADPGQLQQVIMNLCVNARDAMPDGGTLTVATAGVELDEEFVASHAEARVGPHVLLTVADTGCGMEASVAERVFEPFFTTKDPGLGTGLGLATVYGIVKQTGGHIAVSSRKGQGATFSIYLPVAEGTPQQPAATGTSVRTGTEQILVCEDDDAVRSLTARMLQSAGYTVHLAPDGRSAQEVFETHSGNTDLLIADVIMPDTNGKELAAALKRRHPSLKVLFISGYTADAIAHHGVLEKGVDFLEKPFDRSTLLRKVREVLDRPQKAQ